MSKPPLRGARGHRALRAPHPRLLDQRRDRAGSAARHVPRVHAGGLERDEPSARACRRGPDARAPAAGLRHRHDRRDPGEPPAARLQPRVVPARVDGAAGVRDGRRRHGRLQLGLRPVALHGARGQLRDRPEWRGADAPVPPDGEGAERVRPPRGDGRRLQPHERVRPGGEVGPRPDRARLLPPAERRGCGRDVDLLPEHGDRARDDGEAHGRLGRDLGEASTRSTASAST